MPKKPKRKPASPEPKNINDLAGMVRAIVAARGDNQVKIDYMRHPLRLPILDVYHLALALDPCHRTTIRPDGWGTVEHVVSPDTETALRSQLLQRTAVVMYNVLGRMNNGDWGDKGENKELLEIAEALAGAKPQAGGGKPTKCPPLTDRAAAVLDLLKKLPKGRALTCPAIVDALNNLCPPVLIDESTLTKDIIPPLKEYHCVKNKRRVGYYIDTQY